VSGGKCLLKNSYRILGVFIIIITLIFITNIQATLNPYIASEGMLVLVCLGSFMFLLDIIKHKKYPSIILTLFGFGFCAILSTYINNGNGRDNLLMTITTIVFWIIILIVSYIVARKNKNSQVPFYMITITLPLIVYFFYQVFQLEFNKRSILINSVYYVILLLPIILSIKQTYIKLFGVLVICASVIISLKRTALIAVVLSILAYFLVSLLVVEKQRKSIKKTMYILSSLLVASIGIILLYDYLIKYYNLDWILRMQSLQTDGGSNRDLVWEATIKMQYNSNAFEWLFGHGFNAVSRNSPLNLSAHNDFLEVLYDYGVVTFGFYIGLIFSLIKTMRRMYKSKFELAPQFSSSIVMFLIMSTTSHLIIYPTYFTYLAFFWGISIAQYEHYSEIMMNNFFLKID
jgi:hypothetical protein